MALMLPLALVRQLHDIVVIRGMRVLGFRIWGMGIWRERIILRPAMILMPAKHVAQPENQKRCDHRKQDDIDKLKAFTH